MVNGSSMSGNNLSQILEKKGRLYSVVTGSKRLTRVDAKQLWDSFSFQELGELAQLVRFRHNPAKVVTYLVDRNINYTNVCNTDCSFCAFYRHDPKHPESYVLSKTILEQKIDEALSVGATRILLQGGHNDELPFDYYVDLIDWLNKNFKIELNAFSPSEIHQMTLVSGKPANEVLAILKDHGLAGLPGGGAEILDDQIRKRVSPKKISSDRWIEIMGHAQDLGLVTTATMVIGFGEELENRIEHFERIRALQDRALERGNSGFNLFVSWTHQFNENTSLGRSRWVAQYGVGSVEYLKNLALARLYLDNIKHHQASWPTCGAAIAEVGLQCGCDDIGSTMMEENVVSKAGAPTKQKWSMSPEELRMHIRYAGFRPAQRDSSFNLVKVFSDEQEIEQPATTLLKAV